MRPWGRSSLLEGNEGTSHEGHALLWWGCRATLVEIVAWATSSQASSSYPTHFPESPQRSHGEAEAEAGTVFYPRRFQVLEFHSLRIRIVSI